MISAAEYQVLAALADGLTWEGVSHRLGISRHTVHRHRTNVAQKTGAVGIIDIFRALGWLRVPDYKRTFDPSVHAGQCDRDRASS